jgi:hypothetical protein
MDARPPVPNRVSPLQANVVSHIIVSLSRLM